MYKNTLPKISFLCLLIHTYLGQDMLFNSTYKIVINSLGGVIMKKIIGILAILLVTSNIWAQGPGTTNANFLKTNQGIIPIAMGETYVAIAEGIDTIYWNPAGLKQLQNTTASFMHSFWLEDIKIEHIACGLPIGELGTIGIGFTLVNCGSIDKTIENNHGQYLGEEGKVSAVSWSGIATYSQKLGKLLLLKSDFLDQILLGASFKLISENIADAKLTGHGFDIGLLWKLQSESSSDTYQGWQVGIVGQNLGHTTEKTLPINLKAGIGYIWPSLIFSRDVLNLGLDVLFPIDNKIKTSLGCEYGYKGKRLEVYGRAGYKIGNEIKDHDILSGFSCGAGLGIIGGGIKYNLNYAYVPYGELDITHRIALQISFLSR